MKCLFSWLVAAGSMFAFTTVAQARTATVEVAQNAETGAFTVTFANHASETNGLWVVYGATDRGEGTAGWEHAEFLQTVYPETESITYPAPAGWGDTVKAIRFVLSEVPYDYDYTLDFLRSGDTATTGYGNKRIVLNDFDFNTKYRVALTMREVKHNSSGNLAVFSTRDTQGSGTPYFTLFWISGTTWRFDYNTVNNNSSAGAQAGTIYSIVADGKNGLYVDGVKRGTAKLTYLDQGVNGHLEFFCANQIAGTMSNSNGNMDLFGAQVYDSAKADAQLLVNLVPMVKNGRAGMYDTIRDKYYYNDTTAGDFKLTAGPSRVESENPYFASALYKVQEAGPTIFTPASYMEDATDYDNKDGGILDGTSALKLTGNNNWGGHFTVSNGTLVAKFGEGLGANDNLLLVDGAFGGYDGIATNALGVGAGEISVAQNKYLAYGAVNGDLRVNIGGKGEPWVPTETDYRIKFAAPVGEGVVTFENPITLDPTIRQEPILRNVTGQSVLAGNVTSEGGAKVNLYGGNDFNAVGETVFAGSTNTFATFSQKSGGWTFGAGTTNVVNGNFNVESGLFQAKDADIRLTAALGYASTLNVTGGKAIFTGGEALFAGANIGASGTDQSATEYLRPQVVMAGKVRLDGGLAAGSYGSMTIYPNAASFALTLEDGADVFMGNLNFYQRNIIHRGGKLVLNGSYGFNKMGNGNGTNGGTSRYVLDGGRLEAQKAIQSDASGAKAYFCFAGGTLANRVKTNSFFEDFGPDSRVDVAGKFGGTFEVNYDTAITNNITPSEYRSNTWNYGSEDYLTAPAFTKTGAKTLTLTGTCSYNCATDIAAGTLKLEGEEATLPETGVVRVTGGTLDLGGKAQTLKALCGTAGAVKNGAITVTEGVFPGGDGTVGSFTLGATVAGTLKLDVKADGTGDSLVLAQGTTLDLSQIDLVLAIEADTPKTIRAIKAIQGSVTGSFKSVAGLPNGWSVRVAANEVRVGPNHGLALIVR